MACAASTCCFGPRGPDTLDCAHVGTGQVLYDTPGIYSWTAPAGVSTVSVVCVGGGGGAGNWDPNTGLGGGSGGGGESPTVCSRRALDNCSNSDESGASASAEPAEA